MGKICLSCFKMKSDEYEICPYCGYIEGTPPKQDYHLYPGVVLKNRYIVGECIGFGGFGITYRAYDRVLSMVVAVKEFFPSGLVSRAAGDLKVGHFSGEKKKEYDIHLKRFMDEASNMAKFSKEQDIVNVYNFFPENGTAYIIMEYIEATLLKDYMRQHKKIPQEEAIGYILPLLDALQKIHNTGIIHRDISPDNIFILGKGRIKLFDFGAAKFGNEDDTMVAPVIKPGYAPPEQYRSSTEPLPAMDIYAAGAIFYEMLTGKKPMESTDRMEKDTLLPPSKTGIPVDRHIDKIIRKAMSLNAEERFESAKDFADAIRNETMVEISEEVIAKIQKRRKYIGIGAGILCAGIIGAVVLFSTILKPGGLAESAKGAAIDVWYPVSDDESEAEEMTKTMEEIEEKFKENYSDSDILVELSAVKESEYEEKLEKAALKGELPDVYCTDYDTGVLPDGVDLTEFIASLKDDSVIYQNQYEQYYPKKDTLPLSFESMVVYASYTQDSEGIPSFYEIQKDIIDQDDPKIYINQEDKTVLLCLADDSWLSEEDVRSSYETNAEKLNKLISEMKETEDSDMGYLLHEQKISGVAGSTSMFKEIDKQALGTYAVIPLVRDGKNLIYFRNNYSISSQSEKTEQSAGKLFLGFLLSEYAQNKMHVEAGKFFPVNKNIFDEYMSSSPSFSYIRDRIKDTIVVGEKKTAIKEVEEILNK